MKKLKSIWLTLLAVALSAAMVIGSLSFSAFALGTAPAASDVFENVKIARRVKYGGTFDISASSPATVTVKAPSGKDVTPSAVPGTVTASEVGTYTVTYTQGDESYDFSVYSYTENDYSIKVDGNGADIPTYIKKGSEITLPGAKLVYYDEDGNVVDDSAEVKARFSAGADVVVSGDTAAKYTASRSGVLTIQYYAYLGGGSKLYTKDFTVRVQDTFEDTSAPTLSVSNVPRTGNINKSVSLPVATTTDDFDQNVKVDITVTFAGEPVKEVELDDNGFAVSVKDTAVAFDNDKVMSFYPTEKGQYKVTYIATDDSGNQSARHEYEIDVSDTSAPVINDIDDWKIPEKWGLTVKKAESADDDTAVKADDATISFPIPEVVDNAGTEGLTVSFEISDSKGNTVVEYDNILDEEETFTGSESTYDTEAVAFKDLKFDFNKVGSNTATKTGSYNVEYVARDASGNRVTKKYTIEVSNTYTDVNYPSSAKVNDAPEYIVVGGSQETFTVPSVTVADSETSRLHTEYTIVSDAAESEGYVTSVSVDGGEVADIKSDNGKHYLEFDNGDKLLLNTELELKVKTTDSVGQAKESETYTVAVVTPDSLSGQTLDVTNTLAAPADEYVAKNAVVLSGTVEISATKANYKYTGFEVYVVNPDGDELSGGVQIETFYNSANSADGKIVIRNISFTPEKAGTYKLVVRAFNLADVSSATVFNITVVSDDSGDIDFSASKIPTTGSVYETYAFRKTEVTDKVTGEPVDGYYVVHRVTGGRMSVMNNEFTALTAGTYHFRDYIIDAALDEVYSEKAETYNISVTGEDKPVIEALGLVPTYSKVNDTVNLPLFIGVAEHGNVTPDVAVSDKDGNNIELTKVDENGDDILVSGGQLAGYTFVPESDGQYTVTVTASYRGVSADALSFTINVGDVVAPDFSLTETQQTKYKINSEFKFNKITVVASEGEPVGDFTYTKTLVDPSGEEVATVSGTGTTYANRENSGSTITLSKSGTYTVTYEVTDENGNTSTQKYSITVTAQASGSSVSLTAISTVLIIVGIVLIVGVIVYLVRYRKIKPKDEKK